MFTVLPPEFFDNWKPLVKTVLCWTNETTTISRLTSRGEDPYVHDNKYYCASYKKLAQEFDVPIIDTTTREIDASANEVFEYIDLWLHEQKKGKEMSRALAPLIIWDFDGTLAYREGGMWSATLASVVNDSKLIERVVAPEDFIPYLSKGFPWHTPNILHSHIVTPDQWWTELSDVLANAIKLGSGISDEHVTLLLPEVRRAYTDASCWRVYPDVVACLELLSLRGYIHRILSNHVPELESLVESLGLSRHFDIVLSSAIHGCEKPHPNSFTLALGESEAKTTWMVGDSIDADILGAAASNIRGILVRKNNPKAIFAIEDFTTLPALIASQPLRTK